MSVTSLTERLERARAERQARRPGELERLCGWPVRALHAARSADESAPCIRAVASWATAGGSCILVLSGGPGVGKTAAAAWWALHRPGPVQFVTAERYVTSSSYDGSRDAWLHAEALVLDDIGVEYRDAKGNAASALDALVDEFYSCQRPLVITTNLDKDAFKGRVGPRIVDRVRECGGWRSFANAQSFRGAR